MAVYVGELRPDNRIGQSAVMVARTVPELQAMALRLELPWRFMLQRPPRFLVTAGQARRAIGLGARPCRHEEALRYATDGSQPDLWRTPAPDEPETREGTPAMPAAAGQALAGVPSGERRSKGGLHDLVPLDDLQAYAGVSRETLWRWCMRGVAGQGERVTMKHSRGRGGMLLSTRYNVDKFRAEWAEARRGSYLADREQAGRASSDDYLTAMGM